ncbi:hypothetical protein [Lactiplantibacillus plantarum]|uniref:hypothetical protein n=1 Tax=Lactiplantibacillus plantarum TaxID=1590 RepID=UPI0028773695|nr:hypothetical protein [Lactiplantibacillus plantarum]WND30260.1 hypothetical protein RI127_11150 [Lactiplantibacillus plantarum]
MNATYKDEINLYIQFCSTFFKDSFILDHLQNKLLLRLFQTLTVLDVISDYDEDTPKAVQNQAKKAKKSTFKLLYAIPTCEDLFISTCFRQLSEELLKIVYAKIVDNSISKSNLSKLSYRNIWESGIKKTRQYQRDIQFKNDIDKINYIFKQKSDELHSKNSDTNNLTVYLQQIISDGSDFSERVLYSNIKIISEFTIDWLPRICALDVNLMTMAQRSLYLKMVTSLHT